MPSCENNKTARAHVKIGFVLVVIMICCATAASAADVTLAWDANTEPDLDGYIVYYGTVSRVQQDYPHSTDVGDVTQHTLTGLSDGQVYYFAVKAYDTSGNQSAYSAELSHQIGGPTPPVDSDGDTLSDDDEINVYFTNPNNADSDGDGLSDGAEVNTHHTNPLAADSDGDGLSDSNEVNQSGTNPNDADSDNDGLSDGAEVDTHHTNPLAADSDGDGLSDSNEVNQTGTSPRNADSDGDGLSDGAEVNTYGTDPMAADSDGDGFSDGEEVAGGSDPLVDDAPVNNPPYAPVLVLPNNNDIEVTLTPVLVTEEFADPDPSDTHSQTQWQISTDGGFSYLIFDLISDGFLTTLPLHDAILSRNTTYYWRVRVTDNRGLTSDWSDPFVFKTIVDSTEDQNLNGIPDNQEVVESTDLDDNKVADAEQLDIMCLNTIVGGVPIGMKWSNNVTAVETLSSSDGTEISETLNRPSRLPYGVISFKVYVANRGDTVEITFMSNDPFPADLRWYKYNLANGWYDYSSHVQFSTNAKKLVLTLTDGGDGDGDGVENGVIVDPSAVLTSDTTSADASSSSSYLQDSGGGQPSSDSKASCFITAASETDRACANMGGWQRWMSVPFGIAVGFILLGLLARWHRGIRKDA